MKVFIFLLTLLFTSFIQASLIIVGDTDSDFNTLGRDQFLYKITQMYPKKTNNLNFTKISQNRNDLGYGAAITNEGDLYIWGGLPSTSTVNLIQKMTTVSKTTDVSSSNTHLLFISGGITYCFGLIFIYLFFRIKCKL
jgi:hypothetical protein